MKQCKAGSVQLIDASVPHGLACNTWLQLSPRLNHWFKGCRSHSQDELQRQTHHLSKPLRNMSCVINQCHCQYRWWAQTKSVILSLKKRMKMMRRRKTKEILWEACLLSSMWRNWRPSWIRTCKTLDWQTIVRVDFGHGSSERHGMVIVKGRVSARALLGAAAAVFPSAVYSCNFVVLTLNSFLL